MVTAEDSQLVERAREGDQRAFAQLVRLNQDRVFRFVLRMTGSRDDALDLTQETFMKAWQALPRWQPQAQFRTWLFQIARNGALDLLRRRAVLDFVPIDDEPELPAHAPTAEDRLELRQRYRMLDDALRRLPAEHREILLLREVEEMSYAEIAATLNIEEGTVKSRLARARAALLDRCRRMSRENDHG